MQGCGAQPRAQVAPQRPPPALERPWWAVEVAPRVLRAAQILGSLSVGPAAAALKVVPEGADSPLSLPAGSSERPLPRPQDIRLSALHPRLSPCSFLFPLLPLPRETFLYPRPLASAGKPSLFLPRATPPVLSRPGSSNTFPGWVASPLALITLYCSQS